MTDSGTAASHDIDRFVEQQRKAAAILGEQDRDRIVRERECKRLTGLSRTTRWRKEKQGEFPLRRQLGDNSVGWVLSELLEWLNSRVPTTPPPPTIPPASQPAKRGRGRPRKAAAAISAT
jgi:prophage regulatory protein